MHRTFGDLVQELQASLTKEFSEGQVRESFSAVKPSIPRELDPGFLNMKMVPSLEWGVSI